MVTPPTPTCPQSLVNLNLSVSMDLTIWTFHIEEVIQYVIFCVYLLSFSVMFSKVHPYGPMYEYFITFYGASIPLYTTFCLFLVDRHWSCFQFIILMNNTSLKTHVHFLYVDIYFSISLSIYL